jgi:hypothetical protein
MPDEGHSALHNIRVLVCTPQFGMMPAHPVRRVVGRRTGGSPWLRTGCLLAPVALVGISFFVIVFISPTLGAALETVPALVVLATLFVQVGLLLRVFLSSSAGNAPHLRWPLLRTTTDGIGQAVHATWLAQMAGSRPLLLLLTGVRALGLAALLIRLTAFAGEQVVYSLVGPAAAPAVPLALIALALQVAATFLWPWTSAGLAAAFGIWLATLLRGAFWRESARAAAALLYVFAIMLLGLAAIYAPLAAEGGGDVPWYLVRLMFSVLVGGGIGLLPLEQTAQVWGLVPHGYAIGPLLLLAALGQAVVSAWLLRFAVARASAPR